MRNGNRWRVFAVDTEHHRIAARRLDDGARAAFSGDYLRGHITHGYAVTVHSAQGVTADTTHAVLGEKCSRALLYVAVTRGRESNQAYLYERRAAETEHEQPHPDGLHVMRRGTSRDAAALIRNIIATRDDRLAPRMTLPPTPNTSSCSSGCARCWTAAPMPYTAGARPTEIGVMPTPNSWSNGSAGSNSTSVAAMTSTTASTSEWSRSPPTSARLLSERICGSAPTPTDTAVAGTHFASRPTCCRTG